MDTSNTCPAVRTLLKPINLHVSVYHVHFTQCRNKVERISKNHIVNNLVDAYLRANPHKKRPEEDLKELDAKNKITKDMVGT